MLRNKKKRTSHVVNFAVRVDHTVKKKEYEKIYKYLDLVRELKKTMIPVVVGSLETVSKGLAKRLEEYENRPSRSQQL